MEQTPPNTGAVAAPALREAVLKHLGKDVPLRLHAGEYLSNEIARSGTFYELPILEALRQLAPRHRVVVDAGANIGNHALFFLNYLELERLVCFEPFPANFELLHHNLEPFAAKVELHRTALGASDATGSMTYYPGNLGMCEVDARRPGTIPIRTLDSFELDHVTLVKLDVENSYEAALRGALGTLARCRPALFVEGEFNKIFPIIGPLGYVCVGYWAYDCNNYCFMPLLKPSRR